MLLKPMSLHQHHLVVFLGEELLQVLAGIVRNPAEEFGVHPRDPRRGLAQPLAVRILAYCRKDLTNCPFDAREVDVSHEFSFARAVADRGSERGGSVRPRNGFLTGF
jgi:hypothetical protein